MISLTAQITAESPTTNIYDYKVAVAARNRALERLQQQTREIEVLFVDNKFQIS